MPTFVLEERQKKNGGQWYKAPELSELQSDSAEDAAKRVKDQIDIINSIDVGCRCRPTFSGDRINNSEFRIREIS